jgi:cytochrome c biogenesis protein CcdA
MTAALALAFGAGLVATINPCGFAMLPAYLSYFMGLRSDDTSRAGAVRTAFAVGGVVSLGFLVVFGIAGIVITAGFRAFTSWIPWIALGVGFAIGLLGLSMALGYEPKIVLPKASRARTGSGLRPIFGFGVSYGVASLSCTLPVFLVAVAGQLTQQSLLGGVGVFLAYTAGMSFMLLIVTIVLALGKQTIVSRLRASARYINRISGAILVLAGAFIVWFWTTEITSGATALGESAAFRAVERIQSTLLNFIADRTLLIGGVFAAVIAIAAVYAITSRSQTAPDHDADAFGADRPERDLIDVDATSD